MGHISEAEGNKPLTTAFGHLGVWKVGYINIKNKTNGLNERDFMGFSGKKGNKIKREWKEDKKERNRQMENVNCSSPLLKKCILSSQDSW